MIHLANQRCQAFCLCIGILSVLTACTSAPSAEASKSRTAERPATIDVRAITPPELKAERKITLEGEALSLFDAAMQAYARKEYGKASVTLREVTMKAPHSAEARFFLGICYLMTNDTDAAIRELKTAAVLGNSEYVEDAHYFLGQAYARKSDAVNATRELDRVIESNGTRADKARTLREIVNVSVR